MIDYRKGIVHTTDERWFSYFRPSDEITLVDEVNFWRPSAQSAFRALREGEPFFFRLKAPVNAIAGFGFFALQTIIPIPLAWDVFKDRNGDPDFLSFRRRIADYRSATSTSLLEPLNCLVLRDATFLPRAMWLPWNRSEDWSPNIVSFKGYSLDEHPGCLLAQLLQSAAIRRVHETSTEYEVLPPGERAMANRAVVVRQGQGIFRARLLQAYNQRCAVTAEKSMPALEAAHIQPYLGPESNHVQNGILMRADFHNLYDVGYLTITPEYRLEVSHDLREDFENGIYYYGMRGTRIRVPELIEQQPSRDALRWHNDNVFLG
jgi:putative restriction endonuclease